MSDWNPSLYLKFSNERTQPSLDLIARIALDAPAAIIDLGCGSGNSTEALRRRWPGAAVTGLDSSPQMIEAARREHPAGRWVLADIADWRADTPYDLVFSNATLQWLRNHRELFPGLLAQVAGGGALAVQMPHSGKVAVRRLILNVADAPEWRDRMDRARGATAIEDAATYYDVLRPHSARLDLWVTEYQHVLAGPDAILDWIRATSLRPFLDALANAQERSSFEARLRALIAEAFPARVDGNVLFPFTRLFLVAYR